jgi:uncharacterized protein
MQQQILNYVQNQIAQAPSRLKGHITDFNDKPYPQRHIYKTLENHLENFLEGQAEQRWIVVPGLRGIGKTTVLSQLFLHLTSRFDILRFLYVSLDEVAGLLDSNLMETLEAYEIILGESFERLKEPLFIFVDEAQYDPKWGLALKSLFDKSKKVFICCTGSSALSLQTNPDIYRRVAMTKLYPLSFPEYQMLKHEVYPKKGLKARLKQALYFSENTNEAYDKLKPLEKEVRNYWARIDKLQIQQYLTSGTFPFALKFKSPNQLYEAISGLLDKIIQKDIESLKLFDVKTLHSIKRLLFLLADAVDVLSVNKLHNVVGIESPITIRNVLSVLEQAELLIRIPPYGSQTSKLNKPSKHLFMSPAIRMSLLSIAGKEATYHTRMGRLMEDAAALHFYREFVGSGIGSLSYDPAQGSADFVLQIANQKDIVIEIGIGKKGPKQVKNTMQKIKCNYGIVVSDGNLKKVDGENIIQIPLQYFLMM